MKTTYKYGFGALIALMGATFTACGDFEPTGYETVPELPTALNLKAEIVKHDINISWQLPASKNISDVQMILDGRSSNPISLGADATSYTVKGQPLGVEGMYTVKVCYDDNRYISEGVTATATLPEEQLAGVTGLSKVVEGRSVTLSWSLPASGDVTGVRLYRDGDVAAAVTIDSPVTTYTFKAQPMDVDLKYTVEAMYDTYYPSEPANVEVKIPLIPAKMAFLLGADTWRDLEDDDERAAARWFSGLDNAEFIQPSQISELDADIYPVIWIEIDRVGIGMGWDRLPAPFSSESTIAALKEYTANGGNLFLSNMATQLTVPLGFVPADMPPTVFGDGEGGSGDDVWVINPHLGWDFRDGSDQGYYDRAEHAVFAGLTLEDPNNYGYSTLPLIGPGQREDHNCLWDCNIYGRGVYPDVIANFEATTGSLVLATWGHVRDHCVAGMVEFYANAQHGRCIANGLAAYEWNQNSGVNPYQGNIEKLTENILNYLK